MKINLIVRLSREKSTHCTASSPHFALFRQNASPTAVCTCAQTCRSPLRRDDCRWTVSIPLIRFSLGITPDKCTHAIVNYFDTVTPQQCNRLPPLSRDLRSSREILAQRHSFAISQPITNKNFYRKIHFLQREGLEKLMKVFLLWKREISRIAFGPFINHVTIASADKWIITKSIILGHRDWFRYKVVPLQRDFYF